VAVAWQIEEKQRELEEERLRLAAMLEEVREQRRRRYGSMVPCWTANICESVS
jgi:hypothetical protein